MNTSTKGIAEEIRNMVEQAEQAMRELHSQIGQDMDINPSAKRVYLSKIAYAGESMLRQSLPLLRSLLEERDERILWQQDREKYIEQLQQENERITKERDEAKQWALKWKDRSLISAEVEQENKKTIQQLREELEQVRTDSEARYLFDKERTIRLESELEQVKKERDESKEYFRIKQNQVWALDKERELIRSQLAATTGGVQKLSAELDRRYKESMHKWDTEADMYEQGKADAYDMSEQLIKSYLGKEESP